jgi:hypothetical protein
LILAAPAAGQRNPQEPKNLIGNGGFENPPVTFGSALYLSAAGAWSASAGSLALQNHVGVTRPFEGDQHLELTAPSVVSQTCATKPGASYALSLAYCPRSDAGNVVFEVRFAGSLLESVSVPAGSAATWRPLSYLVTGVSAQDQVEVRVLTGSPRGVLVSS